MNDDRSLGDVSGGAWPAGGIGLADPPSTALSGPGSILASCLLMQDAVAANTVSVRSGAYPGSLAGVVAVFANPFLDGKEEALVVDESGQLTWLQRAASETGWLQSRVPGVDPQGVGEVVVVVHQRDLTTWAIYTRRTDGMPQALQLVRSEEGPDKTVTVKWQVVPGAIAVDATPTVTGVSRLYVYYDGRTPCVTGIDPTSGRIVAITAPFGAAHRFTCRGLHAAFPSAEALVAGRIGGTGSALAWAPVCYVLEGTRLIRYDASTASVEPRTIATNAKSLVGVYRSYAHPDIGCVYIDTAGNLATWNVADEHPSVGTSTPGLGLVTASSWVDVNQMLHIYGRDSANTLKVLHQASWGANGVPVWTQTVGKDPAAADATIPVCVGLVPNVASYAVDPFPDYLPNQLVKLENVATPDEQFSFYTQDLSAPRCTRDKVRLPSTGTPHLVTHYVSEVTVRDQRGTPMPGITVKVSAETLAEIQVDGASYLVGPGHSATLPTNALGRISIATPADSLLPPTLHVDVSGLAQGAVIQPAAAVHDYLAGTGTLPSQQGLFDETAMKEAKVDGKPLVDPDHRGSVGEVVTATKKVFGLAQGKPPTSSLFRGTGPAPPIHGFAIGPAPGRQAGVDGAQLEYREFATRKDFDAHLDEAIRALPEYAGIWEDFVNWAGDVWQGIKDGAIEVVHVVVGAVTTVFIKIAEKIVELVGFVIDTVETAARAAEAVLCLVVDSIGGVVDWLKALFNFRDIWDTKTALESGVTMIFSYGLATLEHVEDVAKDWFAEKETEVTGVFERLKEHYAGRPLGDAGNQLPILTDSSGHGLPPSDILDNPQTTWMINQTFGASALAAAAAGPDPALADSPVASAFQALLDAFDESGVTDEITGVLGDLTALLNTITDSRDPDSAAKASMIALIDIVERLTRLILVALDRLIRAAFAMLKAAAEYAGAAFGTTLPLGPVNTLYRWIQTQAGIADDDVEDLTLGGVVFLMAGFAVTTTYKLIEGVDQAPFPGGVFPNLPAPPWHSDYDPGYRAQDDPLRNWHLRNVHIACGVAGAVGRGFDCYADMAPLLPAASQPVKLLVSIGSAALTCGLFGAVMAFPPTTGTDFPAAGGLWTWAWFCGPVVMSFASIGAFFNGLAKNTSPMLEEAGEVALGPVALCATSGASLILSELAAQDGGTNPYTRVMIDMPTVAGLLQPFRIHMGKEPKWYRVDFIRGGLVATIGNYAQIIPATMMIVAAATDAPRIDPAQKLPAGHVGQPYSYAIKASGGDRVYNRPLKNWTVTVGALPHGLTLNATTGAITGTPAATGVGRATFTVRCSDSYGPPKYADETELSIGIE